MKDLSFAEAVNDPFGPVQRALVAIIGAWQVVRDMYVEAGSPNGPAEDVDNVVAWFRDR